MQLPEHKAALTISHNEHKNSYESVAQHLEMLPDFYQFPNDEEKQKCIDTNELWSIQWYPKTPGGFFCVAASTLEGALHMANHD